MTYLGTGYLCITGSAVFYSCFRVVAAWIPTGDLNRGALVDFQELL